MYIGSDGARYKVTEYPDRIDPFGVLRTKPKTSVPLDGKANTSKANPNTSKNAEASTKAHLDRLFEKLHVDKPDFGTQWDYVQHFSVFQVSQDSVWQEVFRDSNGSFYATTKLPDMPSVLQQELILEEAGLNRRIRDINGNDYRMWNDTKSGI